MNYLKLFSVLKKKFLREFIKGKVQDVHALRIGNNGVTKHNQL